MPAEEQISVEQLGEEAVSEAIVTRAKRFLFKVYSLSCMVIFMFVLGTCDQICVVLKNSNLKLCKWRDAYNVFFLFLYPKVHNFKKTSPKKFFGLNK